MQFGTSYLGHFLFTLLPNVFNVRIMNVSLNGRKLKMKENSTVKLIGTTLSAPHF